MRTASLLVALVAWTAPNAGENIVTIPLDPLPDPKIEARLAEIIEPKREIEVNRGTTSKQIEVIGRLSDSDAAAILAASEPQRAKWIGRERPGEKWWIQIVGDGTHAIIQYWHVCGELCGRRVAFMFERIESGWKYLGKTVDGVS